MHPLAVTTYIFFPPRLNHFMILKEKFNDGFYISRSCCWFYLLIAFHLPVFSQHSIRIELTGVPATHPSDTIFIAGNFNGWDPGKDMLIISRDEKISFIELKNQAAAGVYEFKFTRGNWQKVECSADGKDQPNHLIQLNSDTTVRFSIAGWKDDFAPVSKSHTASANVQIIDTAFGIPQLNRARRIWLYLPPDYVTGKKRYPVLYMHDGQNLFDEFTAGFGEWGIDECVDSMIRKGKPACIVVGIDNGPQRLNEYNPYDSKFGKGEGEQYIDFIANTLKPFIDKNYRTLSLKETTIIAGSSMGGLISWYAMLKYPGIFGNAGVFSPSFWIAPEIKALTDLKGSKLDGQIFFYMGGLEGERYIADMEEITTKLGANSSALIYLAIDPEGNHNELAWRKWFVEFYSWIMESGFNNVINIEN